MQQYQRDQRGRRAYQGSARAIGKVGLEASFLPWDGAKLLQDGLNNCQIVDAYFPLDGYARENESRTHSVAGGLRAGPGSMLAVFDGLRPAKRNMSLSTDCGARRSSGA